LTDLAHISCFDIKQHGGTMAEYLRSESDVALLTRVAMSESSMIREDRRLVMWVVRIRMEIGYSTGSAPSTVKQETLDAGSGQFQVTGPILQITDPRAAAQGGNGPAFACKGYLNGAIYPCDNPAEPDNLASTQLEKWKASYVDAMDILYTPRERFLTKFPEKLRRLEEFRGYGDGNTGKIMQRQIDNGYIQFYTWGNVYKDVSPEDNKLWDELEKNQ
jgi:hypothetical protein